ncbi:exonuclease SbcCD subunit D [Halomonas chromatireducens]|uniref:Nuclease SbcCD subunit D n=1 Tax=Halomonas chromatireducens TaxID=507626 RepID=A0A0X8HF57_9GAMM|nr:exonuclease SbcCD subunit D C-terminal domain-containing protein [Halomonas chromatireducens]AMD01469.1 Nuclease SbcCD subunit D [Halomonas chromatireducens]
MKLIHTADWHLGQTFHGQERHVEHGAFLDWLLQTLEARQPDALLIAGDVFDVVNPSLRAQEQLYGFIVEAHRRLPRLDIVMIAGNHDSGSRIELPGPLMRRLNAHALGRVSWCDDGSLEAERLLVPLTDAADETRAWCLALPFLRPAEVTGNRRESATDGEDEGGYIAGIQRVHRELIDAARRQRRPGQALVAMSHAHLRGAQVSEHSERPIVIGGEESISAALFPNDIAYVALGHLHRPQQVGEPRIRYSGSPLPMDFSEANYPHQVVEVTLEGEALVGSESIAIPRAVELLRVGPAPLDQVLTELEALPREAQEATPEQEASAGGTLPRERWPWLEVRVELDAPRPDLRHRIETALADCPVRLLRIHTRFPTATGAGHDPRVTLESLGPRALFERAWQESYGAMPDAETLRDFDALCQEVLHQASPSEEGNP